MIQEISKLCKLLKRFEYDIVVGEKIDPDKYLIGKKCQFQTITDIVPNKGSFARVLPESVKPV